MTAIHLPAVTTLAPKLMMMDGRELNLGEGSTDIKWISRQAYRAAVQTDTEIEWHCESCAVKWSTPGEPVAVSSRLENSLSTSSEPLHSPTIEVSWGPHSGQFLKEQFEDSTVDGTIEDSTEDPTIQECPVGEFPVTYKIVEQDSKRAK